MTGTFKHTAAVVFEQVNDLVGQKHGVYLEEFGMRKVLVSPAIYGLLQTDKAAVLEGLMVSVDGEMRWIFDILEGK